MNSTYSFGDLTGVMASPIGPFSFEGMGAGEGGITVAMAMERTAHDVGADGSVMVSKMAGNNGTVTIVVQQTSDFHKWLLAWFNALIMADASLWAASNIMLRSVSMGISHICTGVSPQKVADQPYQRQGQNITWVLMAADIQNMPV